jgi:hypothetical protein
VKVVPSSRDTQTQNPHAHQVPKLSVVNPQQIVKMRIWKMIQILHQWFIKISYKNSRKMLVLQIPTNNSNKRSKIYGFFRRTKLTERCIFLVICKTEVLELLVFAEYLFSSTTTTNIVFFKLLCMNGTVSVSMDSDEAHEGCAHKQFEHVFIYFHVIS